MKKLTAVSYVTDGIRRFGFFMLPTANVKRMGQDDIRTVMLPSDYNHAQRVLPHRELQHGDTYTLGG